MYMYYSSDILIYNFIIFGHIICLTGTLDCSEFQDGGWYFALQLVREYLYIPHGPAQGVLTKRTVHSGTQTAQYLV